jgi:hypothetical protein
MLANVPMTYMRSFVTVGNGHESRRWQLPDIVRHIDHAKRKVLTFFV